MKINKIVHGDCINELKAFNDNYFDLVISDPPYWKVINEEWDYKWRTEEDYVNWCEKWLKEVYRVIRYGGTMYLFGYFRNLALLVKLLNDIGFEVRQQIIINKGMQAVAGRATKNYKIFPNVTESILFLIKDNKGFSKSLLKSKQDKLGYTSKYINEKLGVKSNGGGMWSIYTGENVCEQFPTKELWGKLTKLLNLKVKYEKVAQTFNAEMGITDVWDDIKFYSEERSHSTQKPIKLIKRLISASSNKGDLVLDPFAGSGSTVISCVELNRNYVAIEIDSKYYKSMCERYEHYIKHPRLF